MKETKTTCSHCGAAILSEEESRSFDGQMLCGDCFREQTVVCDCCGKRVWRDNAEGDAHVTLCSPCYNYEYVNCEDCGRLVHKDDAYYENDDSDYPYCQDCWNRMNNRSIKNYSYKPEPIFYGSGNLFYGVELEIDKGGTYGDSAEELMRIANSAENRIYCKYDGSIPEGFEIVSHPMSLEYHSNEMNWAEMMEKAVSMEYRSHQTSTCGLHVHVNRSAFGDEYEEQEQGLARIVFFVEKHWNELVRFSRRTMENLNRWAAKYATISDSPKETYDKAKGKRMGRYTAVNLQNYDTIEFRMFRGTLRYNTFLASLQLVDEICQCAINMTDREMEEMSWLDFVQKIPSEKKELINYLKEKRLYVNEPITENTESEAI